MNLNFFRVGSVLTEGGSVLILFRGIAMSPYALRALFVLKLGKKLKFVI